MIGLIVYLAEIADGVWIMASWIFALFSIVSIVLHVNADPSNKFRTAGFWFLTAALLSMSVAVLVPTTEAMYKIAGISGQEKGRIDALGKVKP